MLIPHVDAMTPPPMARICTSNPHFPGSDAGLDINPSAHLLSIGPKRSDGVEETVDSGRNKCVLRFLVILREDTSDIEFHLMLA